MRQVEREYGGKSEPPAVAGGSVLVQFRVQALACACYRQPNRVLKKANQATEAQSHGEDTDEK
jgi:hypothetical protein